MHVRLTHLLYSLEEERIMDITRYIQQKYESLLEWGGFAQSRDEREGATPRLCEFGHQVSPGSRVCSYGHRPA